MICWTVKAMTVEEAKAKVVALAESQVGYTEGPNNWNKYADDEKVIRLYGWCPQNQPWCCTYANWVYLNAMGYDIGSRLTYGGTAACSSSAQLFKNNNAWATTPNVGDQAFFYASGGINHTGIVVSVNGTEFVTIEGNYSDKVSKVKHNVGRSDVAGFGRPCWQIVGGASEAKDDPKQEEPKQPQVNHSLVLPLIRTGSKGNSVSLAQSALNLRNYNSGQVDGDFGPKTQAAVNAFQRDNGLVIDGIVGSKTWGKLLERG